MLLAVIFVKCRSVCKILSLKDWLLNWLNFQKSDPANVVVALEKSAQLTAFYRQTTFLSSGILCIQGNVTSIFFKLHELHAKF